MTANRLAHLLLSALALCAVVYAGGTAAAPTASSAPDGSFEGVLVAGGGIDDNSVTVRRADGKRVQAWCTQACGDWFESVGEYDEQRLKPAYVGKRVAVAVRTERNNGRIAGPGEEELLPFVKAIRFIPGSSGNMRLRE